MGLRPCTTALARQCAALPAGRCLAPDPAEWGSRLLCSSWVRHGCQSQPTCSSYAIEALDRHGLLRGAWHEADHEAAHATPRCRLHINERPVNETCPPA
ncbi:membrane protein insertion efficiency factor YidD [Rhodobacteraceae bacterium]|nr:membrane protein insertion efficiency factor YidD [Paracoccaceae bacterium]